MMPPAAWTHWARQISVASGAISWHGAETSTRARSATNEARSGIRQPAIAIRAWSISSATMTTSAPRRLKAARDVRVIGRSPLARRRGRSRFASSASRRCKSTAAPSRYPRRAAASSSRNSVAFIARRRSSRGPALGDRPPRLAGVGSEEHAALERGDRELRRPRGVLRDVRYRVAPERRQRDLLPRAVPEGHARQAGLPVEHAEPERIPVEREARGQGLCAFDDRLELVAAVPRKEHSRARRRGERPGSRGMEGEGGDLAAQASPVGAAPPEPLTDHLVEARARHARVRRRAVDIHRVVRVARGQRVKVGLSLEAELAPGLPAVAAADEAERVREAGARRRVSAAEDELAGNGEAHVVVLGPRRLRPAAAAVDGEAVVAREHEPAPVRAVAETVHVPQRHRFGRARCGRREAEGNRAQPPHHDSNGHPGLRSSLARAVRRCQLTAIASASPGMMIHCASGARPVRITGSRNMSSEYAHEPRISTFTHSLYTVYPTASTVATAPIAPTRHAAIGPARVTTSASASVARPIRTSPAVQCAT